MSRNGDSRVTQGSEVGLVAFDVLIVWALLAVMFLKHHEIREN